MPRCFKLGGENDRSNIVLLTIREHFLIHKLMTKMFSGVRRQKMQYAYWAMCSLFTNGRRNTSRHLAQAKEALKLAATGRRHSLASRQKMSKQRIGKMTGEANHMFGRTGSGHPRYGKPGAMLGRKHDPQSLKRGVEHPGFGKPSPFKGRSHTIETKEKMSNNNIMKRDPNRYAISRWTAEARSAHSQNMQGSGNPNAKIWIMTHKDGEGPIKVSNLKGFCSVNGLSYTALMNARRKGKPYKGWSIAIG